MLISKNLNWYRYAMEQKYLDLLKSPDDPKSLPFDNLFNGQLRIAIPLYNNKIREIISMLENGKGSSGNFYKVDTLNQLAYRIVETQHGPKQVPSRLGKVIQKELGKEYADEWSRQMASANKGDSSEDSYTIIISRHPYDVVRMSDYDEWSSCHSPPGKNYTGVNYFQCAIQEAIEGGPIAYVVHTEDYEEIKDKLQNNEIFHDYDRGIRGIKPISRIRINRYLNETDEYELAIPVVRQYGKQISGFKETIDNWFYERQKNLFGDADFTLRDFGRYGGEYVDHYDDAIFNAFFNTNKFKGKAQYIGESQSTIDVLWQAELDQYDEDARKLRYSSFNAQIEDGQLIVSHNIYFKFGGIDKEKLAFSKYNGVSYLETNRSSTGHELERQREILERLKKREKQTVGLDDEERREMENLSTSVNMLSVKLKQIENIEEISQSVEEIVNRESYFYVTNIGKEWKDGILIIICDISVGEIDNPDAYGERVNEALKFEKEKYNKIYSQIYNFIISLGMITKIPPMNNFLSNYKFKNLNFVFDEEEIVYFIDISVGTVRVPEEQSQAIASEVYDSIYDYVYNLYQQEQSNLLFQIDIPEMKREHLPEPKVKIENVYDHLKEEKIPGKYAIFSISFELPIASLLSYNNSASIQYLKYLDNNYDAIVYRIRQKVEEIVKKYETSIGVTPDVSAGKYNWYTLTKISKKLEGGVNIGPYKNLTHLGEGQNGTAYMDRSTGHVIKHTRSSTEADRAKSLIGKEYSFLPRVYKVLNHNDSWLIEREEVADLPRDEMDFLDTIQMSLEEVDYDFEQFKDNVSQTLEDYGYDESFYSHAIVYAQKLLKLINDVESIGGKPGEVRGDNIGVRGNAYVVRDLDI